MADKITPFERGMAIADKIMGTPSREEERVKKMGGYPSAYTPDRGMSYEFPAPTPDYAELAKVAEGLGLEVSALTPEGKPGFARPRMMKGRSMSVRMEQAKKQALVEMGGGLFGQLAIKTPEGAQELADRALKIFIDGLKLDGIEVPPELKIKKPSIPPFPGKEVGDTATKGNVTYKWDGTQWLLQKKKVGK